MKTSATENPLLKVPPAGRGNRVDARLGSPCEAGGTYLVLGALALVLQHAPLPTSPVDGGGAATPSPRAGRVGVGARC